ncbi:DUF3274 domain-containing protein [Variovorax sp. dw_308]|uniref:T6SS effector phospholipase Tle3 domain-containing protein n=1 Tax=Variovorax sp. dw_308 TaxID=2721546 RepID=UPI001C4468A7|nr:DUF3274 domain-containing protein [Variovorax sp. dw_308]
MGSIYEKSKQAVASDTSCLQVDRVADKKVAVPPDLPGTVIVIHGVNDVGTSFDSVEGGLCDGLADRLGRPFTSGVYRMPAKDDKGKLVVDPDAVFFKRKIDDSTRSPLIPFYWGFRELDAKARPGSQTKHGQAVDRFGNRLDKDLSKGGGPFANATATIPDMWGRGKWGALGLLNMAAGDPLRPVLGNPGRMYMILAAQRMAALISMIRDYDADESVSIVAHSQGCLISLLAQAFLQQKGLPPADTVVITHPPYSLVDDVSWMADAVDLASADGDDAMKGGYKYLQDGQTLRARAETLANIVKHVHASKHQEPQFTALGDAKCRGVVGSKWEPGKDRDNRGKVYLYFCPEDMTVALQSMQGIGWQGVPDFQRGTKLGVKIEPRSSTPLPGPVQHLREPFKELGSGFFQRVFTAKKRPDPGAGQSVLIGQDKVHDFALLVKGESGFDHAAGMTGMARTARQKLEQANADSAGKPIPAPAGSGLDTEAVARKGWRTINGEPLQKKVTADLYAGALQTSDLPLDVARNAPVGAYEEVDPIDASIAATSAYGKAGDHVLQGNEDHYIWQVMRNPDADAKQLMTRGEIQQSPNEATYPYRVARVDWMRAHVEMVLNAGKPNTQSCVVAEAYLCMEGNSGPSRPIGQLLIKRLESPDEMRLRWQNSASGRSFHGAIFGSRANHRNVTAYDVAIGQGKAPSDPLFYQYLCAVADWRLQDLTLMPHGWISRPGIMQWGRFMSLYGCFFAGEAGWRQELIRGNCEYYSNGKLPEILPVLPDGLPSLVVCETMNGKQVTQGAKKVAQADEDEGRALT